MITSLLALRIDKQEQITGFMESHSVTPDNLLSEVIKMSAEK